MMVMIKKTECRCALTYVRIVQCQRMRKKLIEEEDDDGDDCVKDC